MEPIFLVVGPPAVGKSSTSRALAARFPKSVHIPVDDFRNMVVSGIKLPGAEWNEELAQQVALARSSAVHMAFLYQQSGFAVVMDDFWDGNHLSDYQTLFGSPDLHRIILFPRQGEAHQRNLKRSGESSDREYLDQGIQIVYQELSAEVEKLGQEGWVVVDSTSLGIEETATNILKRTASGQ